MGWTLDNGNRCGGRSRVDDSSSCSVLLHDTSKLNDYLSLLLDWNTRMNLCVPLIYPARNLSELRLAHSLFRVAASQATREVLLARHCEDALTLLPHLGPADESLSLLDVGSGAGFPGMVIAIARPRWRVTLLVRAAKSVSSACSYRGYQDSLAKRTRFLDEVVSETPVANVRTVCGKISPLLHRLSASSANRNWRQHAPKTRGTTQRTEKRMMWLSPVLCPT